LKPIKQFITLFKYIYIFFLVPYVSQLDIFDLLTVLNLMRLCDIKADVYQESDFSPDRFKLYGCYTNNTQL